MSDLLVLEDVSVHFGGVKALQDISLAVPGDGVVGLVGPNGSGKTTLLGVASGLTHVTAGEVRFGDRRCNGVPPHELARMGLARTFQHIRLIPELSVRDNVMIGAESGGSRLTGAAARDAVRGALQRTGLGGEEDRRPDELPYGLRRRVEIARALAGRPRLLLLDEPTAGMTAEERAETAELLIEVGHEGTAEVLVEHDFATISAVCDTVHVLNFGRCIAAGPPQAVAAHADVQDAYLGRSGG